jgi:hypothetical protein
MLDSVMSQRSFGCSAHSGAMAPSLLAAQPRTIVPLSLVPGKTQAFASQMVTKGIAPPKWYVLAPAARARLQPLFARFPLDLGRLSLNMGGAFGNAAITFKSTISLATDFGTGNTATFEAQLRLLAHEITHSVQYTRVGFFPFLVRYLREWRASKGDPYGVPPALAGISLREVDPIDSRFYLDQIADRFAAGLGAS